MPPPHRFLASRLPGYVCRACLSKSQVTLRQQPIWLSRNATDGRRPTILKGASQQVDPQEPEIRLFEQTPDGTRVEVQADLLNGIEGQLRGYEEENGHSIEELVGPVDFESFLDGDGQHYSYDPKLRESMDAMTKETEELEALVEKLENIDLGTLSAEDRAKLREELLETATTDGSPTEGIPKAAPSPAPRCESIALSTGVDLLPIPIEPFDGEHRTHIERLNRVLVRNRKTPGRGLASRSLNKDPAKHLWKTYLLCQNAIRSSPHAIPPRVWDILWKMFNTGNGSNMDRMRRIKVIGEDMRSAGIYLSPPRMLLYLESICLSGDSNVAFREWEATGHLPKGQIPFKEYYELGVRMFCHVGNVEEALRAAEICLHGSQDPSRFRVFLPIIQTYLNSKGEYSVQRAWALYIRMNFHFGPQMTMGDYDAVVDMLFTANQPDLALGVFKDMMLTGNTSAAEQNSTAQYRKVVGVDQLGSVAIQNRELNWKNPRALANLPAKINNRFFFGSWIKKLIGDGKLDAAKQVFDLMQIRRIKPDSRHMNGLIGAWFRQGDERSQNLAEDMAWRMIRARLDFVKGRNAAAAYDLEDSIRVVETHDLPSSKPLILIPPATIETFAILIQVYRQGQKSALISDLLDTLRLARIRPSTFFMNELLLWHARIHRTGWAWDTYYFLSREFDVQPDFKTYEILWMLLKTAMDPVRASSSKQQPEFPITCRNLFADMMDRGGKEGLPQEIYDMIILCFSHAFDQTGTAVALRALQQCFGMYPTAETTRTIVLQLARLGLTDDRGIKPKRLNLRSSLTQERIANVTRILETFREQRVEVLSQQGIAFDELQGDAKAEEMLLLLSDLLRYVAHVRIAAEQRHNYNAAIASKTAAEQMGVPDCVPWVAYNQGEIEVV